MLTAIKAGWAFSVSVRSASGPSHMILRQVLGERLVHLGKHPACGGKVAQRSALPMPTAWLPCPGNTNAMLIPNP
jgi:hypothetical protein